MPSELIGTSALSIAALISIVLTMLRHPRWTDTVSIERVSRVFLFGLAAQCLHFMEESLTHFPVRLPELLGLPPWPDDFFVVFNLLWLAVWILSSIGLRAGYRVAMFPIWFFTISCLVNLIAHPILSLAVGGYFPGLLTSPLVGLFGVWLVMRLIALTRPSR
ncbi:hypothetical protein GCM10007862_13770 [Dyella lipolytica]|uniref:HXXEE domain-containing protein n=1 Tax=Dyella lipolytica TaxID=1867835 RepID=A0ABW8IVI0_9GAMM|nr:HXXEE domain-containing protein [Dyella lipolytica]GLQ46326.1 hypothetical protein GCM10007862_13770 [Dyella lipolytica]